MTITTIQQLKELQQILEENLNTEKGYDRVHMEEITLRPEGTFRFTFGCFDDFQEDLPFSIQIKHGSFESLEIEAAADFYQKLAHWPNRESRERQVTIRQLSGIEHMADKVRSLEIEEIVQSILTAKTSLIALEDHSYGK